MGPANQNPAPGQPFPLSKDRQVSTIPKAIVKEGETPFWVYPSAQVNHYIFHVILFLFLNVL